jgi:hypothetical protein
MESCMQQDAEEDQKRDGWTTCLWTRERWELINGEVEQGIEKFGGVLEGRPRPTSGCSVIEEEEEEEEEDTRNVISHNKNF